MLRRYQAPLDLGNLPSSSLFKGVSCLGKIDRTYLLHNATRSAPPRLRARTWTDATRPQAFRLLRCPTPGPAVAPAAQAAGPPRARPARRLPRLLSPAARSILLAAPPAPRRPPSTPLSPRPRRGLRVPLRPHSAAASASAIWSRPRLPEPASWARRRHRSRSPRPRRLTAAHARPAFSVPPAPAPARPHGLGASPP